jgi:cell division protein ZapA
MQPRSAAEISRAELEARETGSAHGATVDSLRVAVLAALNIADELVVLKGRYESLTTSQQMQNAMRSRAGSLAGMLDDVLQERKAS